MDSDIAVDDAIRSLAFIGDLSMGRPIDHSLRTAWLAERVAEAAGGAADDSRRAHDVALLRWSGCTANASGFDRLLGDDVGGRSRMLAHTLRPLRDAERRKMPGLAEIHCEVSGDIAVQLGMDAGVVGGLRHIFETWNGEGQPQGLAGEAVPGVVYQVSLAGDLEILARDHGLDGALERISALGGAKYPAPLAKLMARRAPDWLAELAEGEPAPEGDRTRRARLALIADVAELKLPWLAGQSRRVAECARAAAVQFGLDPGTGALLYRASLIHAIGRAALPNSLWDKPGRLDAADRERTRLMPYWTYRAASAIAALKPEAELASYAWEKLDGSGAFRSLSGTALAPAQRVLATAVALVALRSPRPWRPAHDAVSAARLLREEARAGRFDPDVVEATIAAIDGAPVPAAPRATVALSEREIDVLRRISLGESNKEVARALEISPSTVRTHVENTFRKLECSTRAAATLKAFTLGLL